MISITRIHHARDNLCVETKVNIWSSIEGRIFTFDHEKDELHYIKKSYNRHLNTVSYVFRTMSF